MTNPVVPTPDEAVSQPVSKPWPWPVMLLLLLTIVGAVIVYTRSLSAGLLAIGAVVAMFLLLIAPHEGGHFAFAKLFRMRVHEFSVGLGGRIFGFHWRGTDYAFRWLPFGGYVRIAGMEEGEFEDPAGFHHKPAWQRIVVLLGGPLVNFVVAMMIVTGLWLTQVNYDPAQVVRIAAPSPAYAAGVRAGDHIVSANGTPIHTVGELRAITGAGVPVDLVVRNASGALRHVNVTPTVDTATGTHYIGVQLSEVVTPGDAVVRGVTFPVDTARTIGSGMRDLAIGRVPGGLFGPNGLTGAPGIVYYTVRAADDGFISFFSLVALLSVAIGLFNLVPFPALDGGRIAVVLLEVVRRRPFNRDTEMRFQKFGLVALLGLVVVIMYFDFSRLVNHQFPGMR